MVKQEPVRNLWREPSIIPVQEKAKLLRVLQESEIERLGSNKKIKVNFRLVSSTNRDLKKMVESHTFREDLFYRVNVIQLNLPPLRERCMDIPLLVAEFVKEFCVRERKALTVSDDVMKIFQGYHWPGNVRQLKKAAKALGISRKAFYKRLREFQLL